KVRGVRISPGGNGGAPGGWVRPVAARREDPERGARRGPVVESQHRLDDIGELRRHLYRPRATPIRADWRLVVGQLGAERCVHLRDRARDRDASTGGIAPEHLEPLLGCERGNALQVRRVRTHFPFVRATRQVTALDRGLRRQKTESVRLGRSWPDDDGYLDALVRRRGPDSMRAFYRLALAALDRHVSTTRHLLVSFRLPPSFQLENTRRPTSARGGAPPFFSRSLRLVRARPAARKTRHIPGPRSEDSEMRGKRARSGPRPTPPVGRTRPRSAAAARACVTRAGIRGTVSDDATVPDRVPR